ncbi:MAG: PfkB family carbohydrate kinase [Victivallales bacterium]|jgi:1-phosphofructokinase family hexose kinase
MQGNKASYRKNIIVLGLNPAWQKILLFPELIPGEVNRASSILQSPAGKGINFAKAAKTWGENVTVCQFIGGLTGENIIRELQNSNIREISVKTDAPTRTCTTCLCQKKGETTELIEPSSRVSPSAVKALKKAVVDNLPLCSGLSLCGTYPEGVGPDFYADIAAAARKKGIPVLLDGFSGISETLESGVEILKVNMTEFGRITGERNIYKGAKSFFRNYDVNLVAVTAGHSNSYLFDRSGGYEYALPSISGIINPIGAGDTVSAVFFCEFLKGTPPHEAFRLALGAGTASCLNILPAEFKVGEARTIADKIRCAKIGRK